MSSEKWFGIDQFNGDSETFDTKEEAIAWAKEAIASCEPKNGWPQEVLDGAIKIGKITHESCMTNKRGPNLDDDGEVINTEFDFLCDCEMIEVDNE